MFKIVETLIAIRTRPLYVHFLNRYLYFKMFKIVETSIDIRTRLLYIHFLNRHLFF